MPKDKGSSSDAEQTATPSTSETATGEMIVTYDKSTGQVIRVENVDPSGGRQELNEEEYANFFGYSSDASEQTGYDPNELAYAIAHQQAGFEQGYYHGLLEYEAAISGQTASGYSPEEEAAYYQGMADYNALVGGQ